MSQLVREPARGAMSRAAAYPKGTLGQKATESSVSPQEYMTAAQMMNVYLRLGTVDVTDAVQAAHAASLDVEYPDGVYLVSDVTTLRSRAKIRARDATLLMAAGYAADKPIFENENQGDYTDVDIDIRGITFDGNDNGQGGVARTRTRGLVRFVKVTGLRLRRCVFRDVGYMGATLRSCTRVRVVDCEFSGLGWDVQTDHDGGSALWIASTAAGEDPRDVEIRGCSFQDNYWSAIQLNGVGCRVKGNHFSNNVEAHIYSPKDAELGTHTARYHTIVGNTFDTVTMVDVSGNAIETCAWDSVIADNTIVNCDERGIQLFASRNVVVKGNTIGNCGKSGGSAAGAIVLISNDGSLGTPGVSASYRDRCEKVTVRGNTIYDDQGVPTTKYGVEAVNAYNPKAAAHCCIVGNDFSGVTWAAGGAALSLPAAAWDAATCSAGANPGAAARDWTPVFTTGAGAITSYTVSSAKFEDLGGMVRFDVSVTITDNGTGAGSLRMTLPKTPASSFVFTAWNSSTSRGSMGVWSSGATATIQRSSDGAYPVATGETLRISGTYFPAP